MVMVKESSRDKGESTRITDRIISMPATLPSTVGVCARLVSKVQAYHFITWYRRREDAAKIVPVVPNKVMLDIYLRARSRLDRFRHHAHGHGARIAASGGVGARPRLRRSRPDGSSEKALCNASVYDSGLRVRRAWGGAGTLERPRLAL